MTAYAPLSPAHSVHAYVPESPLRDEQLYLPESPRKNLTTFDKILNGILSRKTEIRQPVRRRTARIQNWREYCKLYMMNERQNYVYFLNEYAKKCKTAAIQYNSLNKNVLERAFFKWKKTYNHPDHKEFLKSSKDILKTYKKRLEFEHKKIKESQSKCIKIFTEHRDFEQRKKTLKLFISHWRDICPTPRKVKEPINVSKDPFHVVTKLTVDESGHVSVKISAPLESIYKNYFHKLKKPPFDEYIEALREFGYPEWALQRMIKKRKDSPLPEKSVMEALQADKPSKPKKAGSKLKKFKTKVE